jgi:hypothetical protein
MSGTVTNESIGKFSRPAKGDGMATLDLIRRDTQAVLHDLS